MNTFEFWLYQDLHVDLIFTITFLFHFFRKIEIIKFATKARQQFIRMLALVKWAAGEDRVDKFQVIMIMQLHLSRPSNST